MVYKIDEKELNFLSTDSVKIIVTLFPHTDWHEIFLH